MNILVNASNLGSTGGAAQVADSICQELVNYPQHKFVVVLSKGLFLTAEIIKSFSNVRVVEYSYPRKDTKSLLTCRNAFLDNLVESEQIGCVLTIFGPMKWVPRCNHVCGIAFPHIALPESPFFKRMSIKGKLKAKARNAYMKYLFRRSSSVFYTENPFITERVKRIFSRSTIYSVTNNYNQVFDHPDSWKQYTLPLHDGCRILCLSSMMPHKNLEITIDIAKILKRDHPDFKFKFVMSVNEAKFPQVPEEVMECFYFCGSVHITECPSLYTQCDIVFQPSLLECFSATYPEAMRMGKPLVVSDLVFARGLCDEAALYFSPLSAKDAASKLFTLANDKTLQETLTTIGKEQLKKFDTYKQRAEKLISICEQL